jgi:hypothetical protein
MQFAQRFVLSLVATVGSIMLFTLIFSFFGISPSTYTPYMYFWTALVVLSLYLSPTPLSILA